MTRGSNPKTETLPYFSGKGDLLMAICGARGLTFRLALMLTLLVWTAQAQQKIDVDKVDFKAIEVSNGIYGLVGAPGTVGTVTVFTGSDGILLVDSQYAVLHQKIMDAIRKISDQPVRFLISTHFHGDHTDGNELMARSGAVIIAHDNARKRMIEQMSHPTRGDRPTQGMLPIVTYADSMTLHFNEEEITVLHPPPAHTDGDSVVYFRHANVIASGDLASGDRYPIYDTAGGGSANGMIAAAEWLLKISNPDTKFIASHGKLLIGAKDIQEQRDMFVTVRDRILSGIRAGNTMEQIIASKPTAEFDEHWKSGVAPEQFVKMFYADLARKGQ